MQDELVVQTVIQLNICRAKLLARISALRLVEDNKERIRDDVDRFTRAKDHIVAALTFIEQTHYAEGGVPLELPWD